MNGGQAAVCVCRCHEGDHRNCSELGGCQSLGCDRAQKRCVVCRWRPYTDEHVCGRCRSFINSNLDELDALHEQVKTAIEPGSRAGEKVSGTRERSAPINLRAFDFSAESIRDAAGLPIDKIVDEFGDQDRLVPLQMWLDIEVYSWLSHPDLQSLSQPVKTTPALLSFLKVRNDWASGNYGGVADYAAGLRRYAATARDILGLREPTPVKLFAPCKRSGCPDRNLYRMPVTVFRATQWIECDTCHNLMSEEEYEDWVKWWADYERSRRRGVTTEPAPIGVAPCPCACHATTQMKPCNIPGGCRATGCDGLGNLKMFQLQGAA